MATIRCEIRRRIQRAAMALGTCLGLGVSAFAFAADPPAVEWERTFGDEGKTGAGFAVEETQDGGYFILGSAPWQFEFDKKFEEIMIFKTDHEGELLWSRTFGGEGTSRCGLFHYAFKPLCQTRDGGFAIAAVKTNTLWVFRFDEDGNTQWEKPYQPQKGVNASTIAQTSDGGFIICGVRSDNPFNTKSAMPVAFLMKLDQDGREAWFRPYGDELPHPSDTIYSVACWVQEATDGGYVACGEYFSSSTNNICYLFHTDTKGELQWSRGFEAEELNHGFFVRQTQDRGYTLLVDGTETSSGILLNGHLVHTDALGHTSWTTRYPDEWYSYAAPTKDGGYILAGGKFNGPVSNRLLKADALGNKLWAGTLGPAGAMLISVQPTSEGGYIVTGAVPTPEVGGSAIYLAKLGPDLPRSAFTRGDADASWDLNITDAVAVLSYLFQSGPAPTCQDATDSDDNGAVNLTDPIFVLGHLFLGGPAPGEPSGKCGADPTEDLLTCEAYGACQ